MKYTRNRFLYAAMIVVVISLGLYTRKMAFALPTVINIYAGDALWALMIFLIFGFMLKTKKTIYIALLGLLFCYLIECSQLYHADWIDYVRRTTLGGLILGYGFLWSDLLAYLLGIGLGVCLELVSRKIQPLKK